jgi:DNA helicase HerA-like ATPase
MSGSHIIVGGTGTGKSTFVKNLLKKVKNKGTIFIYDVNNEYKEYYPYKFDPDYEGFTDKIVKIEKAIIVFEESTIFLNNRSCNANIVDMLIRKRHINNYYIFVFHSLRSVPRYIYEYSNFITLFKTSDSPDLVLRKFEDGRLIDIMTRINKSKKYYSETLKIY